MKKVFVCVNKNGEKQEAKHIQTAEEIAIRWANKPHKSLWILSSDVFF